MLGPLPKLYKAVVAAVAVLVCAGLGAWLAFTLPVTMVAGTGASVGVCIGVVAVLALLHEPSTARARLRHAGLRHRPH